MKLPFLISQVTTISRNERYPDPRLVSISHIVHAEEADKQSLLFYTQKSANAGIPLHLHGDKDMRELTLNPLPKKPPQHQRIPDQTNRIPQHHLRP